MTFSDPEENGTCVLPDFAVLVVELVDDGDLVVADLDLVEVLLQRPRLPTDDRVLTRLRQDEPAKPRIK